MIIGIDGNEANEKMRVGVHQYAFWLLKTLAVLRKEWEGEHQFIIYLKNPPADDFPKEFQGWKYEVLPGEGMWILKKLMPRLWKTKEVDVFMALNHYLPPILPMPSVCAIMDLGYLDNTEQFNKKDFWQLKYWSAISMQRAKTIITISQSAKKDIAKHYKKLAEKTVVIPLGYDENTFNTNISQEAIRKVKNKYKIDGEYILFLSTLKPSKNIEGLLDAYAKITNHKSQITNLRLVIAGKKGWLYDPIFCKVQELKLEGKVIFTDFIPEEDKAPLLSGAKVLVAPSFWEGFGIQVLEAMACGTPVVISNIASLPEVGGKAAIYCDPTDISSIAREIEKVLSMPKAEYNKLKIESVLQAKEFSWERTARETLDVLVKAGSLSSPRMRGSN
jgi:glycosyltransferase involved in cell wall biosynthesis